MALADARSLSPQPRQALCQRAIAAVVEQGRAQQQLARELGVARATVNRWVQCYRARGEPALAARKQGRPIPAWSGRRSPSSFEAAPRMGGAQGVPYRGPPSGVLGSLGPAVGSPALGPARVAREHRALFYLPPYSPERNPDEYLNQDMPMPSASGDRAVPLSSSERFGPTCTNASDGRRS